VQLAEKRSLIEPQHGGQGSTRLVLGDYEQAARRSGNANRNHHPTANAFDSAIGYALILEENRIYLKRMPYTVPGREPRLRSQRTGLGGNAPYPLLAIRHTHDQRKAQTIDRPLVRATQSNAQGRTEAVVQAREPFQLPGRQAHRAQGFIPAALHDSDEQRDIVEQGEHQHPDNIRSGIGLLQPKGRNR
jgi:hypothetical protein